MVSVNATRQRTTITIENYGIYNGYADNETTNKRAISGQRMGQGTGITKKEKKDKERKKDNNNLESVLSLAPPEMVPALRDFIEMRKAINSPMTPRAVELLIGKLNKLSNQSTQVSIAILHQSIENGWKGVYELKEQPASNDVAAAFMRGEF